MKLIVCIDDTDNMESIGSGELLQIMGQELFESGVGKAGFITRHQLYVHEDIPYTSHNSSMCCEIEIDERNYRTVKEYAIGFLEENSAEGSDPGLCIIKRELLPVNMISQLITYGKAAKSSVLTKEMAYQLAESMSEWVHLSEHGGTGQGVIGALAGCGLRLSGNDGRMKGKIYPENPGNLMTVEHICKRYPFDQVRTVTGEYLSGNEKVKIGEELKGVYLDHKIVLLVKEKEDKIYLTCNKKELKVY
jgi:hypothetical protein